MHHDGEAKLPRAARSCRIAQCAQDDKVIERERERERAPTMMIVLMRILLLAVFLWMKQLQAQAG